MNKKLLVCLLVVALLVTSVAVGCAKKPAGQPAQGKKIVCGWSTDNTTDPWRRHQMERGKRALEAKGYEVIVTDALGQTNKQIADIEDLIARKVDLIMVSPRDEKGLQDVLSRAYKQGIKVVLVDRMVAGDQWTAAIRGDNREIGKQTAAFMAQKLNGQGNVVIIEGLPGTTTAIERLNGFKDELAKSPGIKIIGSQPGNYAKADSTAVMENFIVAFGDTINGVYAPSANMAFGALIALENAGKDPSKIVICSVDGEMAEIKAVADGKFASTVQYSNCVDVAAEVCSRILEGKAYPEVLQMMGAFIDSTNAASLYKADGFTLDDVAWEAGKWSLEGLMAKSKVFTKTAWLAR
jgi:ribose transport system substrate-binding protein